MMNILIETLPSNPGLRKQIKNRQEKDPVSVSLDYTSASPSLPFLRRVSLLSVS